MINILDFVRYLQYPVRKGVAIFLNDTLNLHLREDNISDLIVVATPDPLKHTMVVELDSDNKVSLDGGIYDGSIQLTYEKVDATKVYPTGFYLDHLDPATISLEWILSELHSHTRVLIDPSECTLVEEWDGLYIEFLPESVFWTGRIPIKEHTDFVYSDTSEIVLGEFIKGDILTGFQFDISGLEG